MLVAMDVQYDDARHVARGALIGFEDWTSAQTVCEKVVLVESFAEYQAGAFFQRELGILIQLLQGVENITIIVIDGYARLPNGHALGQMLSEALGHAFPIVGMAKSPFRSMESQFVHRGQGHRPLYVTAVGMDEKEAAAYIKSMYGPFRLPSLLVRVDHLARGYCDPH
ncbi:endonuclease V [Candidatus Uhrbacteria bacterium]|nr:endonuclease V [Candidatus Uhrbacteria bacterium]